MILLSADIDGEPAGAAEASAAPDAPVEVEIAVADGFRRRGVGKALLRALRMALRGVAATMRTETYSEDGVRFALSEGMSVGVRESRQVTVLPSAHAHGAVPRGFEVRSWAGNCPDDLVEDWALLRMRMSEAVPVGELSRIVHAADVEAVRVNERRMQEQGYVLVRSMATRDGAGVGYTEMFLSQFDPEIVHQDDTFVEHRFRGKGVGRALKAENLRRLMSLPRAAESRLLQTYTAVTNEPMLALNRSVGFAEIDVLTILEGPLG